MNIKSKLFLASILATIILILSTSVYAAEFKSRILQQTNLNLKGTYTEGSETQSTVELSQIEQDIYDKIIGGETAKLSLSDVKQNPNIFCIEHNVQIPSFKIDYSKLNEEPNPVKVEDNNMAYILSYPRISGDSSKNIWEQGIQAALWKSIDSKYKIPSSNKKATQIYNEAVAFESYRADADKKQPTATDSEAQINDNIIGPFKVEYVTGVYSNKYFGLITDAKIKDKDGNVILNGDEFSFTDSTGTKEISSLPYNEGNKYPSDYKYPKSGQEFYIKIDEGIELVGTKLYFTFDDVHTSGEYLKMGATYDSPGGSSGTYYCPDCQKKLNASAEYHTYNGKTYPDYYITKKSLLVKCGDTYDEVIGAPESIGAKGILYRCGIMSKRVKTSEYIQGDRNGEINYQDVRCGNTYGFYKYAWVGTYYMQVHKEFHTVTCGVGKKYFTVTNFEKIGCGKTFTTDYSYYTKDGGFIEAGSTRKCGASWGPTEPQIGKKAQKLIIATGQRTGSDATLTFDIPDKTGTYQVELLKVDSNDNSINLSGAKFSVTMPGETSAKTFVTGKNGRVNLGSIKIETEGTDTFEIKETEAPDGYIKLDGNITLTVTKTVSQKGYVVSDVSISDTTNANVSLNDNIITITVKDNKVQAGSYELELVKIDNNSASTKLAGAKFEVTMPGASAAKTVETGPNGSVNIGSAEISKVGTDTITIKETQAPSGYKELIGEITVTVTKAISGDKYVLSDVRISDTTNANVTLNGNKITVTIKNISLQSVHVEKQWFDAGNKDGLRKNITAELYVDNEQEVIDSVILSAENDWQHTFTDLPKYNEDGSIIVYKVKESGVPEGYISKVEGTTITNTEVIDIPVEKIWEDDDNKLGYRPDSITAILKADGEEVARADVTKANDWKYTFKDVPKYNSSGNEINYTIEEVSVSKYQIKSITGDSSKFTITNIILIDIGGRVWLDNPTGKQEDLNGKYDAGKDQNLGGIRVILHRDGQSDIETTTKADGTYIFKDQLIEGQYSISFEYQGQEYMPVAVTQLNSGNYTSVDSAGAENTADRNALNNKFHEIVNGTAKNIKGQNTVSLKYTKDTSKHTSTLNRADEGFVNATKIQAHTVNFSGSAEYRGYINLGLVRRAQVDLRLVANVKNVEMNINGINEAYTKDSDGNSFDDVDSITFSYDGSLFSTKVYNQKVYYSDYTYRISDYNDAEEGTVQVTPQNANELKVYITYAIKVANAENKAGKVSELKLWYPEEYHMVSSWYSTNKNAATGNEVKWADYRTVDGQTVISGEDVKYRETTTAGIKDVAVDSNNPVYVFIRFEVEKDANGRIKLGTRNVLSEITGYTTDEGLIDVNSEPGNFNVSTKENIMKTYEDDSATAISLNLNTDINFKREITGFVWEDSISGKDSDGVNIGDGIFNEGDNAKQNNVIVQLVELVEIDGKQREYIWQEAVTGSNKVSYMDNEAKLHEGNRAKTVTGVGTGEYKFEGFIPGNYIVRFVYGQTIVNDIVVLSGQDYKSTTYTGLGDNTSSAKDNKARRLEVINISKNQTPELVEVLRNEGKSAEDLANHTWMNADTVDTMEFGISTLNPGHKVNFGLALRPQAKLKITKEILGVKITNSGIVLADTEQGINTGIRKNNNSSWNIELDDELINGAELQVKYRITITNTGDKDTLFNYFEGDTAYGTVEEQKQPIKSSATLVYDMPQKIGFDEQDGWTKLNTDTLTLSTDKLSTALIPISVAPDDKATMEITLSKVMAIGGDDDLYTFNNAIIMSRRNDVGRRVDQDNLDAGAGVVVTDPTGQARIYYGLWITVAALVIVGVVIIKKTVLSKK